MTEEVLKIEEETPPEDMEFGKIAHLMTGQRSRDGAFANNGAGENNGHPDAGDPDSSAWTMGMSAGKAYTILKNGRRNPSLSRRSHCPRLSG